MIVDPGSVLESLGSARRFADPGAPLKARMMAARGALPLPPTQLVSVLFALTLDPEPEVQERAAQSLDELPERVLDNALESSLHAGTLAFLAEKLREDEPRLKAIALNSATSDDTFCFLASLPFRALIDIVSRNQTRLLRCSALCDALGENPVTSQGTIDRVLEFLGLSRGESAEEEPEGPVPPDPIGDEPAPDFDPDDPSSLPPQLLEDVEEGHEEKAEERTKSLTSLLLTMTVIQKVKLARFGNQEARGLLVRDRNRIVASAAIRSPKIRDNEVVQFAKARNLSDDVLRIIASTREWTKNYQVQLGLATNPKTPLPSAIKFLNYLTDRDLKNIMRSRDVPSPVSQQARRILSRKGKV